MTNINTSEYWNEVYRLESEKNLDWRYYENSGKMILEKINVEDSILELGCGTGNLGLKIKEKGSTYKGIDISVKAVEIARNKGLKCYVSDIMTEPKSFCKPFDIVIASEFLEHFTSKELITVLAKCKSFADRAIFVVPDDCLGQDECKEHYQKFTAESLKSKLEIYYKNVEIETVKDSACKGLVRINSLVAFCSNNNAKWV